MYMRGLLAGAVWGTVAGLVGFAVCEWVATIRPITLVERVGISLFTVLGLTVLLIGVLSLLETAGVRVR